MGSENTYHECGPVDTTQYPYMEPQTEKEYNAIAFMQAAKFESQLHDLIGNYNNSVLGQMETAGTINDGPMQMLLIAYKRLKDINEHFKNKNK